MTTTSPSKADRPGLHRRPSARVSRPMAGMSSTWPTATIVEAIDRAIQAAKADTAPSLIVVATHIGYGSPPARHRRGPRRAARRRGDGRRQGEAGLARGGASTFPPRSPGSFPPGAGCAAQRCRRSGQRIWTACAHPDLAAEFEAAWRGDCRRTGTRPCPSSGR